MRWKLRESAKIEGTGADIQYMEIRLNKRTSTKYREEIVRIGAFFSNMWNFCLLHTLKRGFYLCLFRAKLSRNITFLSTQMKPLAMRKTTKKCIERKKERKNNVLSAGNSKNG